MLRQAALLGLLLLGLGTPRHSVQGAGRRRDPSGEEVGLLALARLTTGDQCWSLDVHVVAGLGG